MLKTTSIDYEMQGGMNKKAVILGLSEQDAIQFLRKITGNKISRINNIGFDTTIHGITDEALAYINKKSNAQNQEDSKKTVESQEPQVTYICPWCDKTFEKASSLKAHMNRAHNVKMVESNSPDKEEAK